VDLLSDLSLYALCDHALQNTLRDSDYGRTFLRFILPYLPDMFIGMDVPIAMGKSPNIWIFLMGSTL
jgi:hypothetical protein